MSVCLVCGAECRGKTCSGPCRAKLSRSKRTPEAHAHGAHGQEQAKAHALTQAMIDSLPPCVVKPTAQPGDDGSLPTVDWRHTKTYAQTIYNLLTMTVSELRDLRQFIPCWKHARETT